MSFYRTKIILLASILLVSVTYSPAYAVLGLSKCEKVKKQIISYEGEEKPLIAKWNVYSGKYHSQLSDYQNAANQKSWIKIVDLEVKMYGLEMNNLKCFTPTQQIYIKKQYPLWKAEQSLNRFYPNDFNGAKNYRYSEIYWDSIYDQ